VLRLGGTPFARSSDMTCAAARAAQNELEPVRTPNAPRLEPVRTRERWPWTALT
jgi:hypothetical protein